MFTATDRWLVTNAKLSPPAPCQMNFISPVRLALKCLQNGFYLENLHSYRSLSLSIALCRRHLPPNANSISLPTAFTLQLSSNASFHLKAYMPHSMPHPKGILLCSPNLLSHLLTDCFASRRKNPMKNPDLHE